MNLEYLKLNLFFKISIFLFIIFIIKIEKGKIIEIIINEPILPPNNEELIINNFNKSQYNLDHPRYHFQDEFKKRKLFKINYSYYPYLHLESNLSYDENAMYIYNLTGMLNITKLDYYYLKKEEIINPLIHNHIHISMAFDKNYTDLSLISIASILNTSSTNTYIHIHILGLNFGLEEIKKITYLKNINNKVEFIFYNAKQVEYDFEQGKMEGREFGIFAKILSPQIINNTNKILILDSGDILCQKDLSEVYFYDIKDNYFGWILELTAGNYFGFKDKFRTNNFHPNAGAYLVNVLLYRKDELYKKAVFVSKSYHSFDCPVQDILSTIANYKFKFIPLNFNICLYYENEEDKKKRKKTQLVADWMNYQQFSPFKYSSDEILNAMSDPVIHHFYIGKMHKEDNNCNKFVFQWSKYSNLTGQFNNLKLNYPKPFHCEKFLVQ